MSNYVLSSGTTARYTSMEELRFGFGLKPIVKRTSDDNKLKGQREKFCNKHKCQECGVPMTWVSGNVMTCMNPKCKGIKVEREKKDGTKVISYEVSFDLLDETGAEIASNIF